MLQVPTEKARAETANRKALIAPLRRNANLIKEMRVQLKPYQNPLAKHEVWERHQKLIVFGAAAPKATPNLRRKLAAWEKQKPRPVAGGAFLAGNLAV